MVREALNSSTTWPKKDDHDSGDPRAQFARYCRSDHFLGLGKIAEEGSAHSTNPTSTRILNVFDLANLAHIYKGDFYENSLNQF